MTPLAVLLLTVSASLHATWNLLGKRENPSPAFMLVANSLGTLCVLPVLFLAGFSLPGFSGTIWLFLLLTGFFQAVYYVALAGAYRSGDLSMAYPLLRALPVIMVTILTQSLGLGKPLGAWAILGMFLVATGCLIVPLRKFSDIRWRNYLNTTCLMALVAALGTVGYSMIDSEALRVLRMQPMGAQPADNLILTLLYAFFEGASASLWLAFFILSRKNERSALFQIHRSGFYQAALVGVSIYAAYILVLLAMGFVTNVSYVVAFRQISIPIGAFLGLVVLKEPRYFPKFVGVATVFLGLVLVGLG